MIELVQGGILEPAGNEQYEWQFSFSTIDRVRKVVRM
jgi:hypothetical protein